MLLIDEIDRADEAFEAFSARDARRVPGDDPGVRNDRARARPYVILTSNRCRELSDALRRRCLYLWLDYPTPEQEVAILRTRLPEIDARLAEQITRFMTYLREQPFRKVPGVAESLDWALALDALASCRARRANAWNRRSGAS